MITVANIARHQQSKACLYCFCLTKVNLMPQGNKKEEEKEDDDDVDDNFLWKQLPRSVKTHSHVKQLFPFIQFYQPYFWHEN